MSDQVVPASEGRNMLMFLIPSFAGILFFMAPVFIDGAMSFPLSLMAKALKSLLGDAMLPLVTSVITLTAVVSLWASLFKPELNKQSPIFDSLFNTTPVWLLVRVLAAVFALATINQWGPEMIWGADTGSLVLHDLLPSLFVTFIFAGLLLPLLLSFGLLELLGTLLSKIMRPVFRLPGRAAIDCLSSWLGDGTVGVMLTNKQYEDKQYTQREATVVATMFSTVGITFSLVVLTQVGLQQLFVPFYLSICVSGVLAAIVLQRIPPLSKKKDQFIDGTRREADSELIPEGYTAFSYGLKLALARAARINSLTDIARQGAKNAMDMVFGVLPAVMTIGTIGLIIAEGTPLFSLLGTPFIPLLELLQLPEAAAASETILVGFADMYVPSILAASIDSDMTRFVIAALSVTQLIFMSETGAVILGSKIPLNLLELIVIFLLRTLITLPVITLFAHFIF
ncbi:YjiH family protein [Endozoicomonas lisbonensis]|uniref:Nucleoside recognition membrane protein YjiH n=1 Tax=Endozoicomonas lisbonensis TaxID=3120522 RepID=A0ABV2SCT8_9GAMM